MQTRKNTLKKGFTLVELMAVVTIIGILSSLGVASLQQAVQNTRVRDAAVNVAAFMERVAQEAKQKNSPLCVTVNGNTMFARKYTESTSTCSNAAEDIVDRMEVEETVAFHSGSKTIDGISQNMYGQNAVFVPRIGLTSFRGIYNNNAYSESGNYILCYGSASGQTCAGIVKTTSSNRFASYISHDAGITWSKL